MEEDNQKPKPQPSGDKTPPRPPKRPAVGFYPGDDGSGRKRRATITKVAIGEGLFSRMTDTKRQYGHVLLRIEPSGKNDGIEIVSDVSADVLPDEFVESVKESVRGALQSGVVIGDPAFDNHIVVGIIVHVIGGTFRKGDSTDMGYRLAGIFALKKALKLAEPIEFR